MRHLVIAIMTVMLLALAAASRPQSTGTADPAKESSKRKSKKVWTTEDLSKIRGGVSVVGEKPAPPKTDEDDTEADEAEVSKLPEPEKTVEVERCLSRSWSAAVDAILAGQGVGLGRSFWMDRFFGGDVCPATLPAAATLAKRIDGDHYLDDGSKVKLQAVVLGVNAPKGLVDASERDSSCVVVWKGHPYLATHLGGIVWVSDDGSRTYEIQEIDLFDPYEDRRAKLSVKRGDRESEIEAIVDIRVTR